MPESWWLKVKRAQRHMVELRSMIRAYSESHPYEIVPIGEPHKKAKPWRYKLTATPPDPMVAMTVGDLVHDLRSALDHIVVGCSQRKHRKNAAYPIAYQNLWLRGPDGQFTHRDDKGREDFDRAIRGLSDKAKAIVKLAQPYNSTGDPVTDILGILSRLDNTDKHKGIILVNSGVKGGAIHLFHKGIEVQTLPLRETQFLEANKEIISFRPMTPGSIRHSEVEVKSSGASSIHFEDSGIPGNEGPFFHALIPTMLGSQRAVRRILRILEPYVLREDTTIRKKGRRHNLPLT